MTTTTITGQAQARRLYPDATVTYFPVRFLVRGPALSRPSQAPRVRDDGDGDLAERDAAGKSARHEADPRERPHLRPIVSALSRSAPADRPDPAQLRPHPRARADGSRALHRDRREQRIGRGDGEREVRLRAGRHSTGSRAPDRVPHRRPQSPHPRIDDGRRGRGAAA